MTEKPVFFHSDKRTNLDMSIAFTNALLGDVKLDSPVQTRKVKIK
ncbi:MAG: hypothetical protein WC784_04085 [Candidatus Shapirobacteria bacterium]|jgi:hypothetical protein